MKYNISVEDNRVIFDGHADSVESCNAITQICDALEENSAFRKVEYRNGYAEFEVLQKSDDLKFKSDRDFSIGDSFNVQYTVELQVFVESDKVRVVSEYDDVIRTFVPDSNNGIFVGLSFSRPIGLYPDIDIGIGQNRTFEGGFITMYPVYQRPTGLFYDDSVVYNASTYKWIDPIYKTIEITNGEAVSSEDVEWLIANTTIHALNGNIEVKTDGATVSASGDSLSITTNWQ